MRIKEIEAKSIFVASKLPDADFVVNPYVGCSYACAYCYASFMGRFAGEPIEEWGNYVNVKVNAVDVAREEVAAMRPETRKRTVLLSSVTDAYQGLEGRYRLSRGILEVLAEAKWQGRVSILTKSPLVTRDIDVLGRLALPDVGLTVTSTDDNISKWLEVRAPKVTSRLWALKQITEAGLPAYAFVGPLLPHFRKSPELLDQLFGSIAQTGATEVYIEQINLKAYIRGRMEPRLAMESAEVRESYVAARDDEHRMVLAALVHELLRKHGLRLRLDEVIYHAGAAPEARAAVPRVVP